jgi:uroporphyrinogen III methyltransferase/synthase
MSGRVYFIGAGPGDAGLLTLRGAEALARCDVVFYDDGIAAETIARAGKASSRAIADPARVAADLIAHAREGKTVARVMAFDPLIFAEGACEVADVSRAKIPFEVAPGIGALEAAGAFAGIAIATRACTKVRT